MGRQDAQGDRLKPPENIRISIIVACRNERAHMPAFLDSLLEQDLEGIDWEAVVADGMSDDGTREVVEAYCARHPRLRLILNPSRIVSTGLNAAIRVSRGTIILRMDAHTRYAPDYCRRSIETLERTQAANVGGPARTAARGALAAAIAAAYHSFFSTGGGRFHSEDYEGWVDTVPYGCWRRETLERIGLFDETLVRNQDDELNLRLLRAGLKIWQSPQIMSWYSPRASLKGLFRQYFQYGFWKVAVIRKHRLPGSWRHLVPAGFVLGNAVLLAGAVVDGRAPGLGMNLWAVFWLGGASAYAAATLAASLLAARNYGWATLLHLPTVFATYHFAYGLGFLTGLLTLAGQPGRGLRSAGLFTRISR